jgi:hypothetical protein
MILSKSDRSRIEVGSSWLLGIVGHLLYLLIPIIRQASRLMLIDAGMPARDIHGALNVLLLKLKSKQIASRSKLAITVS